MQIKLNYPGRVAPITPSGAVPPASFITPDSGGGDALQAGASKLLAGEHAEQAQAQNEAQAEAKHQAREAAAQAKHDAERARRNKMATSFAQYQVDAETAADEVSTQLTSGNVSQADAPNVLSERLAAIRKQHIEALDPTSQAELGDNLILFDNRANRTLGKAVQQKAKQDRAGTFTELTESLQRLAVSDPAGAVARARGAYLGDGTTPGEGTQLFGADVATKQFQQFQENAYAAHFTERLNRVRRDGKALSSLEQDVSGNTTLDPDKKNILLGRITGFKETIASAAARAQESRLRTVAAQMDATEKMTLAGFEPTAQQLTALSAAAKGTPYEPVVKAQIGFANQTAQFRAMAPRGQEAFLNDMETKIRANPSPDGVKTLDAYRSIYTAQREAVKTDPISFAKQKGLADVQPLDMSKLDTLPDQLAARTQVARGMQGQYGAPLKVLTTEEAGMLSKFMRDGGVEQKRQLLGVLATGLPDRDAYNATMSQIAPDNPAVAMAGVVSRVQTTKGRLVSDLILRGDGIVNLDKKTDGKPAGGSLLKLPEDTKLQQEFANYEGNAFAGKDQARNTYFQSAKRIYAALSSDEGDNTGVLDGGRWRTAMGLATGGIERMNGRSIVLPYGYDLSKFKDELRTRTDTIAASGTLEVDARQLRNLPLENVGDGRYVFRAGDGVLVDKSQKPVVVDFNQPAVRPTPRAADAPDTSYVTSTHNTRRDIDRRRKEK